MCMYALVCHVSCIMKVLTYLDTTQNTQTNAWTVHSTSSEYDEGASGEGGTEKV